MVAIARVACEYASHRHAQLSAFVCMNVYVHNNYLVILLARTR